MKTTIHWNGPPGQGQSASVDHPRELIHFGHPAPPRQRAADWAQTLTQFQALCSANDFAQALAFMHGEYCFVTIDDVPESARASFKTFVRTKLKGHLPGCLVGTGWT